MRGKRKWREVLDEQVITKYKENKGELKEKKKKERTERYGDDGWKMVEMRNRKEDMQVRMYWMDTKQRNVESNQDIIH